jgi:hypothetical protein
MDELIRRVDSCANESNADTGAEKLPLAASGVHACALPAPSAVRLYPRAQSHRSIALSPPRGRQFLFQRSPPCSRYRSRCVRNNIVCLDARFWAAPGAQPEQMARPHNTIRGARPACGDSRGLGRVSRPPSIGLSSPPLSVLYAADDFPTFPLMLSILGVQPQRKTLTT